MKLDYKSKEKCYLLPKKEKAGLSLRSSSCSSSAPLLLFSVCLPIVFILYVLNAPTPMRFANKQDYNQRTSILQPKNNDVEECDLFKGDWEWDERGPLYTNYSCNTIPFLRNCFLHGRRDTDFLHWRWKPQQCELPRFNPKVFLETVQGKVMAFIGDSLARNQMESLLCLLSQEDTPTQEYKDEEDRFVTWKFPLHNFTLMALWSQFLVTASDRIINGSSTGGFDLQLDKVDPAWARKLPTVDYAIFSDAHWFFRQNYLHQHGKLIGCIYCQTPNVTDLGPEYAIQHAFRAAFDYINNCKDCSGLVTFLRTYSPAHFENGNWDKGGGCNRTMPFNEEEINSGGSDWDHRKVQVEEIKRARKLGEKNGNRFEIIDVTRAMLLRPDGHPGLYWGNKWMKGYNDCIHWCLPGPADTWNELLLWMLRNKTVH